MAEQPKKPDEARKKRTITEIRESKPPGTFVLGCMPCQSYHTVERALTNGTRFMQEAGCDAVKRGALPDDDHSHTVDTKEYEKFLHLVEKRKHA